LILNDRHGLSNWKPVKKAKARLYQVIHFTVQGVLTVVH